MPRTATLPQLEPRVTSLESRVIRIENKIDRLEEKVDDHTRILDEHTRILDEHSAQLRYLQQTVDGHTIRLDVMESKMDRGFEEMRQGFAHLNARFDLFLGV